MTSQGLTTGQNPWQFAAAELAAFPGRWNLALRCLLVSALTIVGSLTFGVPLLPVSIFLIFFAVQSNVVLTQIVGAVIFLGLMIAVGLLFGLVMFTLDRPLLRLLAISFLMLGIMWMMRASTLGQMFYLLGLAVSCAQPYMDFAAPPEIFVRAILWAFMSAFYPLMLCLIVNSVLLPGEPLRHIKQEAHRQLQQIVDIMAYALGDSDTQPAQLDASDIQLGLLGARKMLRFAWMRNKILRQAKGRHLAVADCVTSLREQALLLQRAPGAAAARQHPENARDLMAALHVLDAAIQTEGVFDGRGIRWPQAPTGTLLDTMWYSLQLLADSSGSRPAVAADAPMKPLVADALSNPVYWQYALKTLLCMLVGYFILQATDWIGIETVVVTCLIVAQPSLGASNRKIKLRVLGAGIGSLIALFEIVFLMPYVDSIVGLLLLTLPVLGLAAYLSAGSERVAYMGQQLMFTYALATLLTFGPTTNLTEIRDRMVGIFLGIGISYVVHTLLWPERESAPLARQIGQIILSLANFLRQPPSTEKTGQAQLWEHINDAEDTITLIAVEPHWGQAEGEHESATRHMQLSLANVRELLSRAAILQATLAASEADSVQVQAAQRVLQSVADALQALGDGLLESRDVFYTPAASSNAAVLASWQRERVQLGAGPLRQTLRALVRATSNLLRARTAADVDWQRITVAAESPI